MAEYEAGRTAPPGGRLLLPQHLADLRKSGLSDETIAACRFISVESEQVHQILNWKGGADKLGPCLFIPFFGCDGQRADGFARVKPDRPRTQTKDDGTQRSIKYEQPLKQRVR